MKTTDKNNKGFAHFLAAGVAVAFAALIIAATGENAVLSEEWSRFGVPEWAKEVGSVRRVDFDHVSIINLTVENLSLWSTRPHGIGMLQSLGMKHVKSKIKTLSVRYNRWQQRICVREQR